MDMPAGEMIVDRDVIVTARDGVGLATDVYRPAGDGPFPVLLERTPYDKSAPSRSERTAAVAQPRSRAEVAAYFVRHGYAAVYQDCRYQDCRGRYKSGGHFTKYLSEAEDGCDTLAWLVRQSWCNGRVGTPRMTGSPKLSAPPIVGTGLLRCRYRDSWERPRPMVPGEVYAITIELFPTGNLFRRGDRLALDIASSNFPHFDINPNSGEPEGAMEHPRAACNQVFVDAPHPSHVVLPIIPPGA